MAHIGATRRVDAGVTAAVAAIPGVAAIAAVTGVAAVTDRSSVAAVAAVADGAAGRVITRPVTRIGRRIAGGSRGVAVGVAPVVPRGQHIVGIVGIDRRVAIAAVIAV